MIEIMRTCFTMAFLYLAAIGAVGQTPVSAVPAAPQMAITFDDLPAHGPLPPGESRMDILSKIIAALHDAHVPPTYGFVNGLRTQEQPGDVAVLKAWHDVGNPLATIPGRI